MCSRRVAMWDMKTASLWRIPSTKTLDIDSEFQYNHVNRSFDQDDLLFDLLQEDDGKVSLAKFWSAIKQTGIRTSDTRLKGCWEKFKTKQKEATGETFSTYRVDKDTFKECIAGDLQVIMKAFKTDLVIPEFRSFSDKISELYDLCKKNTKGKVASYIPQLARASPNTWAVSICTIDGQRFNIGDTSVPFCIQSCSKPINYALAVSDLGAAKVHGYVGQEPSGRSSNELTLDHNNQPHNPMINAGAIIVTSLLKTNMQIADRFDYVFGRYKRFAGGEFIGFSNATYLSEREAADRNYALGYYMRENNCFPDSNTNLRQTLEFYFQLCSVEVNTESASVIAATLANGGICPTTGERVLAGDAVRNTLSLMHSCGMYDYSGQFAFKVGLPAMSSVAGNIFIVVPNVMGICCWSPALDEMGNSCRGVQFCEELVKVFNFNTYDDMTVCEKKHDPRKRRIDIAAEGVVNILFGAANGDVTAIRRFAMTGLDMTASDYDGRSALHLACAEGHLPVVRMLLEQCEVPCNPKDRFGFTPMDEARRFNHQDIVRYLEIYEQKLKSGCPPRRRISAALASSPMYRCNSPFNVSPVNSRRGSSHPEGTSPMAPLFGP